MGLKEEYAIRRLKKQSCCEFVVNGELETTTSAGTVAAGASTVSFFNTGAGVATVNGGTLAAGVSVSFPEIANAVYGEFTYDASLTTLVIAVTRKQ